MQTGSLFLVSAPSGAGKTSLVNAALEADSQLVVSVSHTTRPARGGEVDGENYFFVSDDQFVQMIDEGKFLEHANVFGKRYGTSKAEVAAKRALGQDVILEIDWQGAAQVRQKLPDTQSIFIFPPSLNALRDRLENRAQDDLETVDKRMSSAFEEISHWHEFDYLIVNDRFDTALAQLEAVVAGEGADYHRNRQLQALGHLIENLLPQ